MRLTTLPLFLAATVAAQGTPYISPAYYANAEGYGRSAYPFGAEGTAVTGARYQQIHTDLRGRTMTIGGLSLRQDQTDARRQGDALRVDMEVRIGPSSLAGAGVNFDGNFTGTPVIAMSRRVLDFPARNGEANTFLGAFDVTFPFDQPYTYTGNTDLAWETTCRTTTLFFNTSYFSDFVVPQVNVNTVGVGLAARSSGPPPCGNYDLLLSGGLQTGATPNLIVGWIATASTSIIGTPVGVAIGGSDPAIPYTSPICNTTIHTDAQVVVTGLVSNAGRFMVSLVTPWHPSWAGVPISAQGIFLRSGGVALTRGITFHLPPGPPPVPGNANLVGYGLAPPNGQFLEQARQLVVRFNP